MASTYIPINSQTLTSNTATVTFSSIPQTYTDLVLIITGYTTWTDDGSRGYIQFNTDTGSGNTNYSDAWIGSQAANKQTSREVNQPYIAYGVVGNSSTYPSVNEINIHNYRNTSSFGITLSKTGKYATNSNYGNRWTGGVWRNTAAIDTITLKNDGSYATGTTFSLYGIASA
jgi:hypothetical protein